jgi:5-methylthioadenosine/S-adenosylhomocysteine deaminase
MDRTLIRAGTIVTMDPQRRILHGGGIVVRGSSIEAVLATEELYALPRFDGTVVDLGSHVAIPGFIQTHVHLCQTLFRGLAEELELLDWLRLRIFPLEAAHSAASMTASAMAGIAELIRSGTTTILDMGSIHHEESIVRAIEETGLRAFVGKAMMDLNEHYPPLREGTRDSVDSTRAQARRWHRTANGRIRYAVAPRFVLSCTEELLREAMVITEELPGVLFHTHASENRHELEAVRARCGTDNIDYFGQKGLLRPHTCLAHCVWPTDREMSLLAEHRAKVLHCPSSNMKLASGIAPVPAMQARGIAVSLGADGAPCNNRLDMFQEMRLAALIQKPLHGPAAMPAAAVFEMATRGGATALGILDETGSLEAGKHADIVFLDAERVWNGAGVAGNDGIYSAIVHTGSAENVRDVMIDGRWVYSRGRHTTLDEEHSARAAQEELRLLLRRTDVSL